MAGYLRRLVLIYAPVPLSLFAVLTVALRGAWSAPGWTVLLAGSVSVAGLLMAALIQPSPLPEGLSAPMSVRRSMLRYRQITYLRVALPMVTLGIAATASVVGGGLAPYTAALVLAWPQLLLALPGFLMVARARKHMESWGARAYLWGALAQPAPDVRSVPAFVDARERSYGRSPVSEVGTGAGTTGGAAVEAVANGAGDGTGADQSEDGSADGTSGARQAAPGRPPRPPARSRTPAQARSKGKKATKRRRSRAAG